MQQRHINRNQYFSEQIYTTKVHVIPYIEESMEITSDTTVLEIGCGEGGNLLPFLDMGCRVYGVDLNRGKIKKALKFFADHDEAYKATFICEDIYKLSLDDLPAVDLIIMRDVIEHIPNQAKFLAFVKRFLNPGGKIFFGFPPWQMPFGGHQQTCKNKILAHLPWFHLLPRFMYAGLLRAFGEDDKKLISLMEIRDTRISIERFRAIIQEHNYVVDRETLWLFNPNYEVKFNLKPKKQSPLIAGLPWFRNFLTTCCYCLVSLPEAEAKDRAA
jgi:SAM-dependent methyltransferase